MKKIILTDSEPNFDSNSEDLSKIITSRMGLLPRKKGSNEKMHKILIELYERTKLATREKKPEKAVMTVEEMSIYAGITKQTMYEYLERWTDIDFIVKISYIGADSKVMRGYKLNGTNLEEAFLKVKSVVINNLEHTEKHISNLQKMLKNEKIKATMSNTNTINNAANSNNSNNTINPENRNNTTNSNLENTKKTIEKENQQTIEKKVTD